MKVDISRMEAQQNASSRATGRRMNHQTVINSPNLRENPHIDLMHKMPEQIHMDFKQSQAKLQLNYEENPRASETHRSDNQSRSQFQYYMNLQRG